VKTGRLLKFRGGAREVQAYLYCDGDRHRATVYVESGRRDAAPACTLSGDSEEAVEASVRAWIHQHHPDAE